MRKLYIILILIFCLLFVGCGLKYSGKKQPKVVNGILDLTNWDFEKDGIVNLDGEWEFYWKKLLTTDDFLNTPIPKKDGLIKVPGLWNNHKINNKKIGGYGYVTYRLTILINNPDEIMAVKLLDMGTAYDLSINGKQISKNGIVAKSRKEMRPQWLPRVDIFTPDTNKLEFLLQMSNYNDRNGGAWKTIQFGKEEQIRNHQRKLFAFDLFLFGSLLIIGFYNLGIFILRKKDISPFYFALLCLSIALRTITTGEKYLIWLYPNINWEFAVKLEYLSFYVGIPAFVLFLYSIYSKEFSHRVLRSYLIFQSLLSFIVIITPIRIGSHTLLIFEFAVLFTGLYIIYVLIRAAINKRQGAYIFLASFFPILLTGINDSLYSNQIVQTGFFFPLGLFIFILAQSFVLSKRSSKAFSDNEALSKKLSSMMEELQNSMERNQDIITSISDPMFITDAKMKITYFNEAAVKLSGYSVEDVKDKDCEIISSHIKKDLQCVQKDGKPLLNVKFQFINKEEKTFTLLGSFSPIYNTQSETVGGIVILRDISRDLLIEEKIKSVIQQLNAASVQILATTQSQVDSIAKQVTSLNETSITAEEIASTAALIAENSENVAQVAKETQNISLKGFKTVSESVEDIKDIKERVKLVALRMTVLHHHSEKIGGITEIIDEISTQITLLALNGAIEAAGAGEAGRRFNVVATEMRRLAEKTVEATQEIKVLIKEIQDFITRTVKETEGVAEQADKGNILASQSGKVLQNIISSIEQTTRSTQEIGINTQEQKAATEQMTNTIYAINEISMQVQTGIEEISESMKQLQELSNHLQELFAKQ